MVMLLISLVFGMLITDLILYSLTAKEKIKQLKKELEKYEKKYINK